MEDALDDLSETICEIKPIQVNLLVACTGSVATIKFPSLINRLTELFSKSPTMKSILKIKVVVTSNALHFIKKGDIPMSVEVYTDDMEWSSWKTVGDPVLHIDLAKWAHIMLIAPLDANTLAKISQGNCDNLLTCIIRAWVFPRPVFFCPAMNTKMWEHPITGKQIAVLKAWGFAEIPCVIKQLACGDTGNGGMAELDTIVEQIKQIVKRLTKN